MVNASVTYYLALVVVMGLLEGCFSSEMEERLTRELLGAYNSKARPVTNDSDAVTVTFGIALPQLMQVDEKNEVVSTNVWVRQYWRDPRLAWNRTHYRGIRQLSIHPNKLWLPDISILNSATADMAVHGTEARLIVTHRGDVSWLNPAIVKSSCGIDIAFFPVDDQLCELRFGSWSYTLKYMNIIPQKSSADLSSYVENGEWILLSAKAYRKVKEYACCEGKYPEVTFHLELRRRTLFYMMNFFLPCVLIAVLTLLVFLLPPESGERMSFGVTVLLSFTILILMLMEKLPATSKALPLIAVYYACTIIEVSVAMFMACLMMRFYHPEKSSAPLPGWVKMCVMNYCARFVGLSKSADRVRQELVIQDLRQAKLRENRSTANTKMNVLTDHIFKIEEAGAKREEWRMAAIIINRLFVWIYLITIIITLLAVMLQAPRFRSGNL